MRIQFNLHGDVQRREICFQRAWDILLQTFQNNGTVSGECSRIWRLFVNFKSEIEVGKYSNKQDKDCVSFTIKFNKKTADKKNSNVELEQRQRR